MMRTGMVICLLLSSLVLVSCSDVPDSQRATETFADCLQRNGVEAQDLELTLNPDGSVAGISATILSERDVPYEPAIRLACTEEVDLNR